jgi:hypothetical protein
MKKYKKLDYNEQDLESLSNSDLKKLGDYWLRQYLLKSVDRNPQYCPIKKRHFNASDMHCCHYEDRINPWTRYSLLNVHLLSAQSNTWDAQVMVEGYKSKHHKEYGEWLVEEYGVEILNTLRKQAKRTDTFRKEDYIEAINKFRNNE